MNTLTLAEFDKLKTIPAIREALFADDTYTEQLTYRADERGPISKVTVTKNLLTDAVIVKEEITWDYHDTGEVKDIVTRKLDAADVEKAKHTVSHSKDSTSPILTIQKEDTDAIFG